MCLAGCRQTSTPQPSPALPAHEAAAGGWPRTVVDDLGVEVTLEAPPGRVVSLAPGFTETIFAIGAGDRLVGRTDFCDEPPEALAVASVGGLVNPSLEKIVGLEPDLVLVIRGTPSDVIESLRRMGLAVIARDTQTLDEAIGAVRDIGRYLGAERAADALADKLQARKAAVSARTGEVFATRRRPDVLVVLSLDPVFAAGDASFAGDMIRIAGGGNVAGGPELAAAGPWPQLSLEAIVERDPDIIILAADDQGAGSPPSPAEVGRVPGLAEVGAVRQGHVPEIDPDLVSRAGPRLLDGLERLAEVIRRWALEEGPDG